MSKKLKIAQIAPLWTKVPPEKYGGIELIVYLLTEELIKRGHKLTLFASEDSKTSGKLVSVYGKHLFAQKVAMTDQKPNLLNISEAIRRSGEFDILHSHLDVYDQFFVPFSKSPVVSTLHNTIEGNKKNITRFPIFNHYKHHNFISLSYSQRVQAPKGMNFVGNVYNGIQIENFSYNASPKDHFIWVGRFSPIKGAHEAIKAAKKAGVKLKLASGKCHTPIEERYFETKVKPYVDGKQIDFVGEISRKEKSDFFGSAKGLLNPILWPEPFGLVMAESMACGTPVIAFDNGAAPEVVKDKKTGFIVKNIEQMIKAIGKIEKIKRADCRKRAEENFTVEKMVDNYEKIYYKMVNDFRSKKTS